MNSKSLRLHEFLPPGDGRSLIVDASAGLWLGAAPGLEHFSTAITPILPLVDGIVASPGQAGRLAGRTRAEAAMLARGDWTNALRPPDFVLPPETIQHLPLLEPSEALDLGASGLVLYFLLGHEEQIEAGCLRRTVQAALQGGKAGLPLVVDVQPVGPRVVNLPKAIQLGVSYALEGGADGVAIPWPGRQAFAEITKMAAGSPVWLKPASLSSAGEELDQALELGGCGLWLGVEVFGHPDPAGRFSAFASQVHPLAQAG
jgi:DhnA family fructose-bisphosphate aldolase class Ia